MAENSKKYPLTEALELEIFELGEYDMKLIEADDLEAVLAKGSQITLNRELNLYGLCRYPEPPTHTGLLINIKPIIKPERSARLTESQVEAALISYGDFATVKKVIEALFGGGKGKE